MIQLRVRVPIQLKKLMHEYIRLDTHKDISELTRDALREKIKRDAPHIYENLFTNKKNELDV